MKKQFMKSPVISELYSQKLIHSAHLKKLQDIKNNRKTQLNVDRNRTRLINSIRENKAYTFAINYNQDHQQITKQNLSMIRKLTTAKSTSICQQKLHQSHDDSKLSLSSRSRFSFTEVQKSRYLQKENNRLYFKLKSTTSNLKTQRFKVQHDKTERIKQRIMRYSYDANDPTKIGLKSQKLVTLKNSYLSNQTPQTVSRRQSKSVQMKRKGTAQYYDKSQIMSNTIKSINKRYGTASQSLRQNNTTIENHPDKTFLTTQNNGQVCKQKQKKISISIYNNKNKIGFLKENLKAKKILNNEILRKINSMSANQRLQEIDLKNEQKIKNKSQKDEY